MFKFWPEKFDWSWHLLRPIAAAIYGGGEFNECYETARRIELGNVESWYVEWYTVAKHAHDLALIAEERGHITSAREHYLRACNYYRWAQAFLDHDDPRGLSAYEDCVRCFQHAGRWFTPALENVEVPYGKTSLPGYFYPGLGTKDRKVPAVLYIAGSDVPKEELYFLGGRGILDRGMALLTIDMPGQGVSLRKRKIYSRFDYEVPVSAVLDYLQSRPEVDPERIGVIGRSFGGYYSCRALAFDHRPKALVIFGARYKLNESALTHNTRHRLSIVGASTLDEARDIYKRFTLEGLVGRITCPILILHGEDDHLAPLEDARRTYAEATAPKDLVVYKSGQPGSTHCQHDNFPESIPLMLDWLSDKLGHREADRVLASDR